MTKREGYYARIERQRDKLRKRLKKTSSSDGDTINSIIRDFDKLTEKERNPPWQPLMKALMDGDLDAARKLTEDDAVIKKLKKERVPILLQPVNAGDKDIVDYLLARGIDPNIPGEDNLMPLAYAAKNDREDIFISLVKAGARTDVRKNQMKPCVN
jgi:ankyrin repeat protein